VKEKVAKNDFFHSQVKNTKKPFKNEKFIYENLHKSIVVKHMDGYLLEYRGFTPNITRELTTALTGVIRYKNLRRGRAGYYTPGMLRKTKFKRVKSCKLLVESLEDVNLEIMRDDAMVVIRKIKDIDSEGMLTGVEWAKKVCEQKGVMFRERQRKTKKH